MTRAAAIHRIDAKLLLVKGLLPGVIASYGFRIAPDHDGDDSIFIQIVLTNTAAERNKLRANILDIQTLLDAHLYLDYPYSNMMQYFNWRSELEMAEMVKKHKDDAGNVNVIGWGWGEFGTP